MASASCSGEFWPISNQFRRRLPCRNRAPLRQAPGVSSRSTRSSRKFRTGSRTSDPGGIAAGDSLNGCILRCSLISAAMARIARRRGGCNGRLVASYYSPRWRTRPLPVATIPGRINAGQTHTRFRGSEFGAADGLLPSLALRMSAVAPV